MIKSLQKRISTLFMFLLTIIWLVILLLFVNNSYRNNLSDLQQTVRAAAAFQGMALAIGAGQVEGAGRSAEIADGRVQGDHGSPLQYAFRP